MSTKNNTKRTIPEIVELLGIDPYETFIYDITKTIQDLNKANRERLFALSKSSVNDKKIIKDHSSRLALVHILVNLMPESVEIIKELINRKSDKFDYEMHFSLFCFLDDVPDLPGGLKFAREIPSIIEKYLMEIKTETAYAAFMAGDLLGEHWYVDEARPILMKIAKKARYSAGRHSAIHGLEHVLQQLSDDKPKKKEVTFPSSLTLFTRTYAANCPYTRLENGCQTCVLLVVPVFWLGLSPTAGSLRLVC